ncbi:MAG: outer membrane beta-barrel protein, partial [Ferruginibacter sp.]
FSLGNSYSKNNSSKTTHDYNAASGKFDLINNLFTNHFESNYGYTNAGLRLRKQTKTYNYAIGASWQHAELEGKLFSGGKDSVITKGFSNILPTARFQYYFTQFKNALLYYSTNTNQPTVTQLQPVPDNSNPLYVKLGNPNLKQEFTHVLRLNISLVNPYKSRNLFAFFTFQETQNKIVNSDHINSLGVDTVMAVNANGIYTINGSVSWGFPVRFLKGTLELSSNINSYHGKQFINNQQNNIQTNTAGPEIRLDMNPTEKSTVAVNAGLSYSKTAYSLQAARSTKYFTQTYGTDISWQLPKRFYLATDFTYRINSQHADGFNAKVPLWNAAVSKQMLRFNRGELKLSANDLLNQNIGINRSSNQNYIEDSRVINLRRFFLLSFTYSLTKTGLNNGGSGGGMRMITR